MTTIWTVIGDILSVLTIGTCLVSKFPQILTIYQQKSAQGLSLKSLTIEVISYSISTLYNFTNRYRWINYFEYIVLIIQDYILVAVVLFYRRQINQKTIMIFTSYFVIVSLFGFSILPKSILTFLIPGTLPMSVISKSMQLIEIIRTKDSRAISSTTWFISAFSNLTRIYTIMLDSMDYMLLTNFVVSTLLSSAVFVSVLYYKNPQKVKDN